MKRWFIGCIALFLSAASIRDVRAEQTRGTPDPLILHLQNKSPIKTGQILDTSVTLVLPKDESVAIAKSDFSPLEIHKKKHLMVQKGEQTTHRFVFELLALKPGHFVLPPIEIQIVDKEGTIRTKHTASKTVQVGSWISNEPNAKLLGISTKDASKPRSLWQDDFLLLWIWLGILLILLILASGWWAGRTYAAFREKHKPLPPPIPPWQEAEAKLKALREEGVVLFDENRGEEFVDRLSDILRDYLGKRYGFDGLERTSDELLNELRTRAPSDVGLEELSIRFSEYDMIKFAKAEAQAERAEQLLDDAAYLVRKTTPSLSSKEATHE